MQHLKRFRPRAFGTFLLALPLSGIVSQVQPVQAQPVLVTPKLTFKPFPAETKAKLAEFDGLLKGEEICSTRLDFAVKDADLGDIIGKVKKVLPAGTEIEVREPLPVRVTVDLKSTSVGNVLQATAGFMGSKLWVFPSHLVIAPKSKLSPEEEAAIKRRKGGEWAKGALNDGQGWGTSFTHDVAIRAIGVRIQEALGNIDPATGLPPFKKMLATKMSFGDLSPEIQGVVQRLVDSTRNDTLREHPGLPRMTLRPDATFRMDASENGEISLAVFPGLSQQNEGGGIMWGALSK